MRDYTKGHVGPKRRKPPIKVTVTPEPQLAPDVPKTYFATIREVKQIRALVRNEGPVLVDVVSVCDIPELGLFEDLYVLLVQFSGKYYVDTVTVNEKIEPSDSCRISMQGGHSFPHAVKYEQAS